MVDLSVQIVGNCGWANTEGLVLMYLILRELNKIDYKLSGDEIQEIIKNNKSILKIGKAFNVSCWFKKN